MHLKTIAAWAAAFVLIPVAAHAQGGDSGAIVGFVYDQAGNPLSGVKIAASSATQIGGTKITYSDHEGAFRLRALIPGTFEVRASAPKMRTFIQKDMHVGVTAAAEMTVVMELETAVEQVTIVEKAPIVSTTRANVAENFEVDFVENLPHHGRDSIHKDMLGSVGGSINGRMRGGAVNQTLFTQDGFDMRSISPTLKSSAAFEIQTAGYGADNPAAAAGIINMVTKSGSNKFEFEFNATAENNKLQFFRDQRDTRSDTFYYVINPMFAGPILKDRLWYFFNTETHITQDGRQRDVEGIFPDPVPKKRLIQKGSIKLTWQITPRNKLSGITNYELPYEINRVDGLGVDPDAQEIRRTERIFTGLIWESLLTDNIVLRSQAGNTYLPEHIYPSRCVSQPIDCDHIPSVIQTFPRQQKLQNNNNHTRTDLLSFQLFNQLDWFVQTPGIGEHNLQLKDRFYTEQETKRQSRPGDALYELAGTEPLALTTYYSNDPRYEDPRYGWFIGTDVLAKNIVTLADTWRVTRHLTLTPAISQAWAAGGNANGEQVINATVWAPAISAVWDPLHDGRTALRGSFSNYVDIDVAAIARHNIGTQAQKRCLWNATTQAYDTNCVFSGGASSSTIGLPCGPSGLDATGTPCYQALRVPQTREYTLGGQREVVPGVALSLDFMYRKFIHQFEVNETNQIWNPAGSALAPTGAYRNGRPQKINDLGTPDEANRAYTAVTFGVSKREGRFKGNVTYTWSELKGNVFNGTSNLWGDIPGRNVYLYGDLPDDHRHDVKATLSYQAVSWLSFGTRTTYSSGVPYDRLFRNDETGSFDQYRATRGINPGSNINDPQDDRPLRLPDQLEVNVQSRLSLLPLTGQRLDFYVDVLNVLALRTPTSVAQNDAQDFGVARTWMDPFRIRLGINYRY